MVKNYLKFLGLLMAVCVQLTAGAQDNNVLSTKIKKAHNEGTSFEPVTLFHAISGAKHEVLKNENLLATDKTNVETLYGKRPAAVSINFTDAKSNKTYTLEMLRSKPVADNANFGYIENGFRVRTTFVDGVHYQGAITGADKSLAAMSVFADGTVMVLFANEEGNFVVGKLDDGTGNYVFYNDKDMVSRPNMVCNAIELGNTSTGTPQEQGKTTANLCNKVQVYWEGDYQYFQSRSSNLTSSITYMTGLFNQFQVMYQNETISMELKSLYIWITDDAYPNTSSTVGLDIFKGYWNGRNDDFDGDLAHLITRDAHNNGGLAYVDVLSARNYAYAYSEITGSFNTVPTYSWDVMVLTHETGHNLGSHHTHWCGWNTGSGSSCGSIDNCTTQENGSSCTTCPKTFDNALPASSWAGTVMSYCHLVSRGINLSNGFGPLPGGVIRNRVSGTSGLKTVISATLTATPICSSDGAITLAYNANNFGVAPYTYLWTNSSTTQNLTGLSTTGTYGVSIMDANGCQQSASVNVTKYAKPGDGKPTGYIKPVCCNDSAVTINLTANLPTDLSACQTVAWLRTAAALTTYTAAQSAIAVATSVDIIASTNTASINTTTAATLTVASPTPCASQSYYYTPFVARKIRALISVPAATTTTGTVTQSGFNIGRSVSLADQTSGSFTPCDVNDTPTVKSIAVTVSSYTGRANKMSMLLIIDGIVVYRQDGLAGNGSYSIPLTNAMNPLKAMEVDVFDFNCSSSTSCTASTATVSATRSVAYGAVSQITLDKGCAVGQSVQLGFAATDCQVKGSSSTNSVGNVSAVEAGSLNVYPNPANKSVTVQFLAHANGKASIKVTDMLGKVVEARAAEYMKGDNLIQIDVHSWAKGIYSLSFSDGEAVAQNIKLIVQ